VSWALGSCGLNACEGSVPGLGAWVAIWLSGVKEWASIGEPVFSSGRIWQWTPALAARSEDRLCVDDILFEGTLAVTQSTTWMCLICGWIYDESTGDPEHGVPPGTPWDAVPLNWTCPECGARKEDFEMVQI